MASLELLQALYPLGVLTMFLSASIIARPLRMPVRVIT